MDAFIILGISIAFQFAAAFLALRLIPVTGRRKAWVFISTAIFLMAVRRCITLFQMGYGGLEQPRSASTEEWVTLATSMLMLAGIASIAPLLHSMRRSTEAIRESEERYRELVQNAHSIILKMDTQGNIVFFNEFAQSFFDYTEEEIIGRNIMGTIFLPTESGGGDLATLVADIARNPDRCVTGEAEALRRNGERVWISCTRPYLTRMGASRASCALEMI
jgi:PAS domain S-box-containing protein